MPERKPYEPPRIESTQPETRKPYVAPAIAESAPFERLHLTCAHHPAEEPCEDVTPVNS